MIYVYPPDEKEFLTNGQCTLKPNSCIANETLNGEWELALQHPVDEDGKWMHLLVGNIIKAPVPVSVAKREIRYQPFRIYRIVPELNQVSVYARHLTYDLMDNFLYEYKPGNSTPVDIAAQGIFNACKSSHPFIIYSNITDRVDDLSFENVNPLEAILGEDGLVDKSSGELARDWFKLLLLKRVGLDTDIQIRQGKDLLGISYEVDDANVVTRILPTGETEDGNLLYLNERYVDSPLITSYPHPRWIHLPVSEARVSDELTEAQAKDKLKKAAQDEFDKGCDLPDITLDVSFINLTDTLEYATYRPLNTIFLGDSVRVIVKSLRLEIALRMTEYSFDCLLKRYNKVVLGTASDTIAGSMISPRQLPTGGIKGIKLAMGSIGTGHIQFASIGSLQVKNASIDSAHIKYAAIETAHIQDASITNAKIGKAVIESANIAAAAIQRAHIQDASINRAKIDLAAIGTGQIENAAITRAKIAHAAIGTAQIEEAVIDTAHIKDAAITNAKIVSLDAGKIQTGTLDAGNINVVNLKAANITTGKLTSSQIEAGAITAAHIASKTITAAQIQAGIITATSGLLANAAIDTAHIKDAAITNAKIGSLSANKITTGTLDAAAAKIINVDAGSITVGKINGVQIANGTVDMNHLHQTGVVQVISNAQATADGKNKVFYRTLANKPTTAEGLRKDDLWFDLSNEYRLNRWTGSEWVQTPLGPSALDLEIGGTNLLTGTSAEFRNINISQFTGTVQANVMYADHRLKANDLITFRVYLKAINKPLRARISQYRADGTYDAVTGDIVPLGSEGFSTVTTSIGADKVKLACLIQNGDSANLTTLSVEQYKWAKLERGNKPTDWSPAPGDIDELISSVRSTADGKNTAYYQATAPTGGVYSNGDLWFDTTKGYRLSVRSNNAWSASAYSGDAIAASAITAGHIATGAITAGKISAGAILADKIAANAVTSAKIAANAVIADKINAGAITTTKIATGAINADKIAAGAIEAAAIKAGVIDATHIAANTISGNKLAIGTVSATYIADGAITTTKVLANAITTDKINVGAVTANEIAANAVTTAKINAGAVTATQIATGAITAGKVAADAITAGNLQASAVTAEKVAAGAITATQLATNSVTAVKVLAGAITADKIAANAVTAAKVSAGAITTDKLDANAVTAVKIAAGAITTGHLAASSVDASKIKADAITTTHIAAPSRQAIVLEASNRLSHLGENLIINGNAAMGNNTNFSEFTYSSHIHKGSGGRFYTNKRVTMVDDGVPFYEDLTYKLSFDIYVPSTTISLSGRYTGFVPYDVDGLQIANAYTNWVANTNTTLAAALNNGDTVIRLADLTNWKMGADSHNRGIILWGYRNSKGYTFPTRTYSRRAHSNLYASDAAINKTAKTITLSSPWSHGSFAAGTAVNQVSSGSTYIYKGLVGQTLTAGFSHHEAILEGSELSAGKIFYGAKTLKFMIMNNGGTDQESYLYNIRLEVVPDSLKTSYINIANDKIDISSGGKINISAGGELMLNGAMVQINASDANNSHINFGSVFNVGRDSTGVFGLNINSPSDNAIRINGQPIWHKGNILIQSSQPAAGKGTLWLRPNSTQSLIYRYGIKSTSESAYYGGGTKTYTLAAATNDVMSVSGTYNFTVKFTLCNYGNPSYTFGTITLNLYKGNAQLTMTHAGTTLGGWVRREFTIKASTTNTIFTSGTGGIACYIQIAGTKTALLDSFLAHVPGTAIECTITGPGGTSAATPCEIFWCP